jgi:hypothetical protein
MALVVPGFISSVKSYSSIFSFTPLDSDFLSSIDRASLLGLS